MLSTNALERRLKRRVRRVEHTLAAVCAPGFEQELLGELTETLGRSQYQIVSGGVEFKGSLLLAYSANLKLRTANRVLLRIKTFKALTFPMLFDQLRRIEWELWVPNGGSFRVRVAVKDSKLNMKARIVDTCRKAVESTLAAQGISATFDPESDYEFLLRLYENNATVSFNTSGQNLHKRGYKQYSVNAPIRETLAASILRRVNFLNFDVVVDPFCGSGTLVLEASQMELNIAPGAARKFAFMDAPFFEERKWLRLIEQAANDVKDNSSFSRSYFGSDVSRPAVIAATKNANRAGVSRLVEFLHLDYRNFNFAGISRGRNLLVTNPPYGKRLTVAGETNARLFDEIASNLPGWTLAYVKPKSKPVYLSEKYMKKVQVVNFRNGGIPSELHIVTLPSQP